MRAGRSRLAVRGGKGVFSVANARLYGAAFAFEQFDQAQALHAFKCTPPRDEMSLSDRLFTFGRHRPMYIQRTSIEEKSMATSRVFKNGNSQAVRIPAELAYERCDIDVEIERVGDELHIRPVRRSLAGVLAKFAKFSPNFLTAGRGDHDQADRDAL